MRSSMHPLDGREQARLCTPDRATSRLSDLPVIGHVRPSAARNSTSNPSDASKHYTAVTCPRDEYVLAHCVMYSADARVQYSQNWVRYFCRASSRSRRHRPLPNSCLFLNVHVSITCQVYGISYCQPKKVGRSPWQQGLSVRSRISASKIVYHNNISSSR